MILQRHELTTLEHEKIYNAQDQEISYQEMTYLDFFNIVRKIDNIVNNTIGSISKPPGLKRMNDKFMLSDLLTLTSFPMSTENAPEETPVLLLSEEDINYIFFEDENTNATMNIKEYYISYHKAVVVREYSLSDNYIPYEDLKYKINSFIKTDTSGPTLVISVFTFHESKYDDTTLYFLGTELAEIVYAFAQDFKHTIYNTGFDNRRALIVEDYQQGVNPLTLYFIFKYVMVDICALKTLFVKDIEVYKTVLWWAFSLIDEDIICHMIELDYQDESVNNCDEIIIDFIQRISTRYIEKGW